MAPSPTSPSRPASKKHSPLTWLLIVALVFATGFTGFRTYLAVRDFIYWNIHADEPIQPWMTVGFVAHSYHVPPHVLKLALGLPPEPDHTRPTLARIAKTKGVPYATVKARLEYAIVHARPPYPPPAPPPPRRHGAAR